MVIKVRDDKQGERGCEFATGFCDDEPIYCGEPSTHQIGHKYVCTEHAEYVANVTCTRIRP